MGVDSSTQSTKVEVRDADAGALVASGRAAHPAVAAAAQRAARRTRGGTRSVGGGRRPARRDGRRRSRSPASSTAWSLLDAAGPGPAAGQALERHRVGRPRPPAWSTSSAPQAWADAVGSVPLAAFTITKLAWLAAPRTGRRSTRLASVVLPHDYLDLPAHRAPRHRPGRRLGHRLLRPGRPGGGGTDLLERFVGPGPWAERLPEVLGPTDGRRRRRRRGRSASSGSRPGRGRPGHRRQHGRRARRRPARPATSCLSLGTSGTVYATSTTARPPTRPAPSPGSPTPPAASCPLVCTLNATKVTAAFARLLGVDRARARRARPGRAGPAPGDVVRRALPRRRADPEPPRRHRARCTASDPDVSREAAGPGRVRGRGVRAPRRARRARPPRSSVQPDRIVLVGGGARSPAYRQVLADLSGCPCVVPRAPRAGRDRRLRAGRRRAPPAARSKRCRTRGTSGRGRSPSRRPAVRGRSCERPTASPWR